MACFYSFFLYQTNDFPESLMFQIFLKYYLLFESHTSNYLYQSSKVYNFLQILFSYNCN